MKTSAPWNTTKWLPCAHLLSSPPSVFPDTSHECRSNVLPRSNAKILFCCIDYIKSNSIMLIDFSSTSTKLWWVQIFCSQVFSVASNQAKMTHQHSQQVVPYFTHLVPYESWPSPYHICMFHDLTVWYFWGNNPQHTILNITFVWL